MENLNGDNAVYIRYRLDGSLFNLRRLQAHTKTLEQLFRELLFADDAALVAHIESALQRLTSCFPEVAQLFELEVSLKKEDESPLPACTPERVLPSPHHHWRDCVEDRLSVHLPGVHNHIRRQDQQRNGEQIGQVKQRFRQIVQQSMEKQASEAGHQDQRVQSRCTHHPTVRV